MTKVRLHLGDCLDVLASLEENSVDSIVTDPPYGLNFMGKKWDYDVPSVEIWEQCLRVLKPGGHLLAFAGTRTQHRMCVNIEDAGFEIRDMIAWVYGSGFPKSMDISKAIDKAAGVEREVVGEKKKLQSYGKGVNDIYGGGPDKGGIQLITAPATPEAQQWEGWGTALKPALEPITVARKPFKGTVAQNVLEHGTGGINIDACRVELGDEQNPSIARRKSTPPVNNVWADQRSPESYAADRPSEALGRWPANLIHDGSDEVTQLFPQTTSGVPGIRRKPHATNSMAGNLNMTGELEKGFGDSVSAARFFYCAKANKKDRGEGNIHPTVKPTNLMAYLCRLVTPPGGIVLDPFMGSGSTGKAAVLEGLGFIGIERSPDYYAICESRLIIK
jgi:site-specific DNA-methyltransferase (adenine-specific)